MCMTNCHSFSKMKVSFQIYKVKKHDVIYVFSILPPFHFSSHESPLPKQKNKNKQTKNLVQFSSL